MENMLIFLKKYFLIHKVAFIVFCAILFFCLFYFFKDLVVGFLAMAILTIFVFLLMKKRIYQDNNIAKVFLFVFFMHLLAVMFVYYANFHPFSGGADYEGYNNSAIEIANRFKQGNFSLQGISLVNYFPILVGIIYTFTIPTMLIGQMFMAWLAGLSAIILYTIVLEIGGSKRGAFWVCLTAGLLPSYLLFGSLLLKDNLVIFLVLSGILISIKIFKKPSLLKFLLFFIISTLLMHFRFYIGFALIFTFILCWFAISSLRIKKRAIFGIVMAIILGFSPYIVGNGFYGYKLFSNFLNIEKITNFREIVYNPTVQPDSPAVQPDNSAPQPDNTMGTTSSFSVQVLADSPFSFTGNYVKSFTYSLLGPFPWQITQKRHILFLFETIPFYFLLLCMFYIAYRIIRREGFREFLKVYKFSLPIMIFSIFAIGALSLYINNFGIIARIRMPVCILLLSFLAIAGYADIIEEKLPTNIKKLFKIY